MRIKIASAFALCLIACVSAFAEDTPIVDCGAGQSLNGTLSRMGKLQPATLKFKGTCTEYVVVDGFNHLTLQGLSGAAIQQPATNPPASAPYVLFVGASRSVTLSGFAVLSLPSALSGIGIGKGSTDVLVQNVSTDGAWGIVVTEASQVSLVNVTVNITSGYSAITVSGKSDVQIVGGLLHRPADSNWSAGLAVDSGHVTIRGITIRDMQQSINIGSSGSVEVTNFGSTDVGVDVIIDNPAGTNFNGVIVSDGASLNLGVGSAKLRISNAGQWWGGDTGAVFVTNGSTLNAGSNLIISGSQGQGVVVSNGSHAQFAGSSITGGSHGGLVVVNMSTAGVDSSSPLTVISGNGTDLFCDSKSQIAGGLNIANSTVVQCNNFLSGAYENLP